MGMWGLTVICCWGMVSQSTDVDVGMTIIYYWDVVSQSTDGVVGVDSNMLLGHGQSEYRCGCGG